MHKQFKILLYLLLGICTLAYAEQDLTVEQAEIYHQLTHEMRCVTCANQSIADSQAPPAQAMRDLIYHKIQAGEDIEAIRSYLLERYGAYVTYRPPFDWSTSLLWIGPLLLLLFAALILRRMIQS